MKLIMIILAMVLTTKGLAQTKGLYFDPGEAWKKQSLNIEKYKSPKTNLAPEALRETDNITEFPEDPYLSSKEIHHLRKEALKRHLSFREYFHNRNFSQMRNSWLCLKSRLTFQSFTSLFEKVNEKKRSYKEELDTVENSFFVSLYTTRSYNIIGERFGYVPFYHYRGYRVLSWYAEHIFSLKDDSEIKDSMKVIDLKYVRNPEIKLKTNEEEKEYILYYIYEELYDYRGVVAINTEDASDILFLGGPFLPLDNFLKEGFNISELSKNPLVDRGLLYRSIPIPSEYENTSGIGFYSYARMLTYAFCNESTQSLWSLHENGSYDDGKLTLKLDCTPSSRAYTAFSYNAECRYDEPGSFTGRESFFHYPNLLCSSYKGKIVESIKFRFDLNTYDIEFKIDERKDITNYPECSEKE